MTEVAQIQPLHTKQITTDTEFVDYSKTHEHMEKVHGAVLSHNPWREPIFDPDASALKRREITAHIGNAPISSANAFARAHGKEAPIDLEAVAGVASSADELAEIEQLIEMIQSTPSSNEMKESTNEPKKTVRSAQAALMEAYATIRPLISELRFLEAKRMHDKMEKIQEAVEDEVWYQSLIGTTYGLGFAAQAALIVGGRVIFSAETAQTAAALAQYVGTAVTGTTELEKSYLVKPQHKKSMHVQMAAGEKQKQQAMGELEKEMKQMVLELLRLRAETTRRAASAAGG